MRSAAVAASASSIVASKSLLIGWSATSFMLQVRTLKTAMSTLCSGKLLDKLRYLFSQLTDVNGHMMPERFAAFLRDVARISSAVGEERQHQDVSNILLSNPFRVQFRNERGSDYHYCVCHCLFAYHLSFSYRKIQFTYNFGRICRFWKVAYKLQSMHLMYTLQDITFVHYRVLC